MAYYGPRTRVQSNFLNNGRSPYIYKTGYVQKTPYTQALPYSFTKEWDKTLPQAGNWGFTANSVPGMTGALSFPSAYSKAYGKFIEESRTVVNLAVDIAERKQAIDLMAKRSMQMLRFSNHLRHLRFVEAARELNLVPQKQKNSRRYTKLTFPNGEVKLKKRLKSFGDNYLEFHFGWEPLIKDIGDSVELIHDAPFAGSFTKRVVASASESVSRPPVPTVAKWSGSTVGWWPKATVRLSAYVRATDPNLARLNQMGFVNPAVIAWELVPFSFVVDWFTNVGQVLSAYTDQVGFAYENAYTTVFATYQDTTYWNGGVPNYGSAPFVTQPVYDRFSVNVRRSLGISTPKFTFKPVKWPSVTRGLTAVSLLTQFLRTH